MLTYKHNVTTDLELGLTYDSLIITFGQKHFLESPFFAHQHYLPENCNAVCWVFDVLMIFNHISVHFLYKGHLVLKAQPRHSLKYFENLIYGSYSVQQLHCHTNTIMENLKHFQLLRCRMILICLKIDLIKFVLWKSDWICERYRPGRERNQTSTCMRKQPAE